MSETVPPKDVEYQERMEVWINNFIERGSVEEIEAGLVRGALESFGADFGELDEKSRKSLGEYSNRGRHYGMNKVWGDKRLDFRVWCEEWTEEYERERGESLPRVIFTDKESGEKRPSKTEGMRQFLGELTAYSAGCLLWEDLKMRLEARYFNFRKGKNERKRIVIPGYNKGKSFAPASFPPDFPMAAWDELKSWKGQITSFEPLPPEK